MAYRDVTSLLARVEELEAERGRVRARARRIVSQRWARRRVWLGRGAVVSFFVLLVPALFFLSVHSCGCGCCGGSKTKQALNDALSLQPVAEKWSVDHGGACPTPAGLLRDRELSPGSKLTDPWDTPYVIRCEGEEVHVASAGQDRKFGTADDVVR